MFYAGFITPTIEVGYSFMLFLFVGLVLLFFAGFMLHRMFLSVVMLFYYHMNGT